MLELFHPMDYYFLLIIIIIRECIFNVLDNDPDERREEKKAVEMAKPHG